MINSEEIVKKEARGLSDYTNFEVQEILGEYIITQKGNVAKYRIQILYSLKISGTI